MSIFFSSGIKTLWSSSSAFVVCEAAQWDRETHTALRRSSVPMPTEWPTNYPVQTLIIYRLLFPAAILWFGHCLFQSFFFPLFFSLFPFSLCVFYFNLASIRKERLRRWRGKYSLYKLPRKTFVCGLFSSFFFHSHIRWNYDCWQFWLQKSFLLSVDSLLGNPMQESYLDIFFIY